MGYYPEFAQLLEEYLFEAERSGSWLAQGLGINPGTVTRWRNGESRPATPEKVRRLADLLGVRAAAQVEGLLAAAGYAAAPAREQRVITEEAAPELQMSSRFSFNLGLRDAVLLATLGSEPQVIGLATQLLLRKSEPLSAVIVLHTRPNRTPIDAALPTLQRAFAGQPAWPRLETVAMPIDDILSPEQIEVFAKELFQLLKGYVGSGTRVHLLLAGGRKSMAMVGTTVAQMLLGPDDKLWYLYSDEPLRLSRRAALRADDYAELIPVPLPQMSTTAPVYTRPFLAETPQDAFQALEREQQRRLRHFVEQELTAAEKELVKLLVEELLTVAELAGRLNKKPKTVTNQLNSIYSKAESTFGLQPDKGVKREFLRSQLLPYFASEEV
ncbi:MAG: CRISPR-associated ring nuclease [Caldilineaceae bacterium]